MMFKEEKNKRPWLGVKFSHSKVPTMITEEERAYLFWLTSTVWTGEGHVVEIGPWLGGSTVALAAGMKERVFKEIRKLHVYDNFIWKAFMGKRASLPLHDGDSFQEYFTENTKQYSDLMVSYRQSLPDDSLLFDKEIMAKRDINPEQAKILRWDIKEPVEILFIDGAKSWDGLRFLLDEFSNYLIPGKTLFVCQDYKYWGTYWVPLIFEILGDHLELVHNLKFNTVTFRLKSKLEIGKIESLGDFSEMSVDAGMEYLSKASQRLSSINDKLGALILQVCMVRFLAHKGEVRSALEMFRKVESVWPFKENDLNLERARQWLVEQSMQPVPHSRRSKTRRILNRFNVLSP
jgi:hypothetical protein